MYLLAGSCYVVLSCLALSALKTKKVVFDIMISPAVFPFMPLSAQCASTKFDVMLSFWLCTGSDIV